MKFDWKHWLPWLITWFLLLVLISLVAYLIKSDKEARKTIDFIGTPVNDNGEHGNGKPEGQPPKKSNNDDD